jgi:acyl-CoA synthetase (AMP-forming)/AMP-acid ligase II
MNEKEYLERLNRLWVKNWPSRIPREPRYPLGEILLTDYLREWARRKADTPCLIYYGKEVTFKELDDLSDRFADFLASRGFQKGDRVAVFLPNCPQFHIAFFGILKLGCVHVPVNPMFKEHELLYEINDAGAEAVIALDRLFPIIAAVKDQTGLREILVTRLSDYIPKAPTIPVHPSLQTDGGDCPGAVDLMSMLAVQTSVHPEVTVGLDDVVALNYTGGTTGLPKGCEHTQGDMIYTAAAAAATSGMGPDSSSVALNFFPIFWISGENNGVISPVFNGSTVVLLTRWDVEAVLTAIDFYKVSSMVGVVDNYLEIMDHPDLERYDLGSIRSARTTSFVTKLNVNIRNRWKALTGSILRESSYGMTETHTLDTLTTGMQTDNMDLHSKPIFAGLPMPGTQFKVVDFETRQLLPLGKEGEIAIRTPSLMKSYWNKPEETKQAIRKGWFYTGDIGMLDEGGYLHLLGRRKEMLKVKGMSVFPSELESLLGRHPAVAGSGVVGKFDPEKGQVPVAFIKLNPPHKGGVTETEIEQWCRQNMAPYKIPIIIIVNDLPLTATGKVKKEELKKRLV